MFLENCVRMKNQQNIVDTTVQTTFYLQFVGYNGELTFKLANLLGIRDISRQVTVTS